MTLQHMDSPITMNLLLVCARDISDTALSKDVLLLQGFELINIVLYPFKVFRFLCCINKSHTIHTLALRIDS